VHCSHDFKSHHVTLHLEECTAVTAVLLYLKPECSSNLKVKKCDLFPHRDSNRFYSWKFKSVIKHKHGPLYCLGFYWVLILFINLSLFLSDMRTKVSWHFNVFISLHILKTNNLLMPHTSINYSMLYIYWAESVTTDTWCRTHGN
jgi:hypothetical protein